MITYLRSALYEVLNVIITFFYGILGVLFGPLPKTWGHRVLSSWCLVMVLLMRFVCGIRYQLQGKENLALTHRPFVVLSKHQSSWETLYLQVVFRPICTILKKELLRIPFFGWGLRRLNPIAIDRSNPRQALQLIKSEGLNRLKDNYNLLIFPEGTRVEPGKKGKYARGGADIAREAQADVIPVAVNAGRCWPINSFLKHSGTIQVVIGKPIPTKDRGAKDIISEVESWIEGEMQRIENP